MSLNSSRCAQRPEVALAALIEDSIVAPTKPYVDESSLGLRAAVASSDRFISSLLVIKKKVENDARNSFSCLENWTIGDLLGKLQSLAIFNSPNFHVIPLIIGSMRLIIR